MIIKSMSRREKSFSQLFDYMTGKSLQNNKISFSHNLYSKDRDGIIKEFKDNSEHLSERKDRVYLFHEIISITKEMDKELSKDKQKEILLNIAQNYVDRRCPSNLVVGEIHDDKTNNLHIHLMISSNEYGENTNLRLSKATFDQVKKDIEMLVLANYPELNQKKIINKKAGEKLSNKGAELKRRTGQLTQRENIINKLKSIFSTSASKTDFFDKLALSKIEIYVRGNTIGFLSLETGRKHKLKTLGLEDEFKVMSSKIELSGEKSTIDENKSMYAEAKGRTDTFDKKTLNKKTEPKDTPAHLSQRDAMINMLKGIFLTTENIIDFFQKLSSFHLEIYERGNNIGFRNMETGTSYRLTTLDLENEFKIMSDRIELTSKKNDPHEYDKTHPETETKPKPSDKETTTNKPPSFEKTKSEIEIEKEKRREEILRTRNETEKTKSNSKTR